MSKTVLILCTGNSCRSQIAEVLVNHDLGPEVRALSAGTRPQPGRVGTFFVPTRKQPPLTAWAQKAVPTH